jgi:hypothetical protein
MQELVSAAEVKKALNIESFRNLSKDKIIEFVSLIPNMDRDVAIKIIEQFPQYANFASSMISQLNTLCDNALKANAKSQSDVIEAYKKILDDLGELLKKDDITSEERANITEKMVMIADRISAKDTENKAFLINAIKSIAPYAGGALLLAAAIFGVNVKGVKLPSLKK